MRMIIIIPKLQQEKIPINDNKIKEKAKDNKNEIKNNGEGKMKVNKIENMKKEINNKNNPEQEKYLEKEK